jgi:hypothetical protein
MVHPALQASRKLFSAKPRSSDSVNPSMKHRRVVGVQDERNSGIVEAAHGMVAEGWNQSCADVAKKCFIRL